MNFQRTGRSVRNIPVWASNQQSGNRNPGASNAYRNSSAEDEHRKSSTCNRSNTAPQDVLAMVYAPYQKWKDIFDPAAALQKATIFEELYKPFCPCSNREGK